LFRGNATAGTLTFTILKSESLDSVSPCFCPKRQRPLQLAVWPEAAVRASANKGGSPLARPGRAWLWAEPCGAGRPCGTRGVKTPTCREALRAGTSVGEMSSSACGGGARRWGELRHPPSLFPPGRCAIVRCFAHKRPACPLPAPWLSQD
jgi:hypothetical protein